MKAMYLLVVLAAVIFSVIECTPLEEENERSARILGLLGGGGGGADPGSLLGGLFSGLLGSDGLIGNLLGGKGGFLGGLLGGLLKPVLGIVVGVIKSVLGVVTGIVSSVSGKSEKEQASIFDTYPLNQLCPACPALKDAKTIQGCKAHCAAKGWKSRGK
uniref:Uncharacterized protein n=1 Tax=Arion vulgaris TaxID=1028688 RepID=A0A0B6XYT6_9EUPU